ncbi:DNA repair protein RAD51 homolog 4-like [Diorhabda carinulata]|uniref:DNA repair protein RAD51 homolog 4-like n=1 Tax=Diorhabda carinulata TaxID=1163345 RepID=UPI0025A2A068|nr:DNA repair protein RAD51 homolog 4-like [Diorhabda carinulata]
MDDLSASLHTYLNTDILKLLNEAQIITVIDFMNCETKKIEKITSLALKEILEIRKELLKKYSRLRSAFDCYQNILHEFAIIPTGVEKLDLLLEGGLFTGNIYEICGLPASGKTLFCLTLIKNVALTSPDEIIYLDTKCDFLGLKMKQMLSSLNKEHLISTMNRIKVARVFTKNDFLGHLLTLKHSIESGSSTKLIIIDSIATLSFQSSNQNDNNSFLSYIASILHYLTKEYNIVFVITNLITLWNDGDFKNIDVMKEKVTCGSYWYGVPNARISLKKERGECKITLVKAVKFVPNINSCCIKYTDQGFV